MQRAIPFALVPLLAAVLTACGGSGTSNITPPDPVACAETGPYACKTGETEPLYTFQWALNYAKSYFNDFPETFHSGLDLNVEPAHQAGIKGQGVNVLVVDSGVDLHNEDLAPNADFTMSWNLVTETHDPYPLKRSPHRDDPHGTNVAGMIGAAQNGKGVMGIAPLAKMGGVNFLQTGLNHTAEVLGGSAWSSKVDIFNNSWGAVNSVVMGYDDENDFFTPIMRSLKKMRNGKGAIFIKSAGNSFSEDMCGYQKGYYDCSNPIGDWVAREPNSIVVAALNAYGESSSYSSTGSNVWITGMGGEFGAAGNYGEGKYKDNNYSGPTIFSTDLSGCDTGYGYSEARTPFLRGETVRNGVPDNPNCDYSYMNGTSAAAPTISGVVALMLSANPDLTWRDVRDILLLSGRKVDADYAESSRDGVIPYGALTDLRSNTLMPNTVAKLADVRDGATTAPLDLGWQTNGAGHAYSNWYGFGVPDTAKAVALAKEYKANPGRSKTADVNMPDFTPLAYWTNVPANVNQEGVPTDVTKIQNFPYQKTSLVGSFRGNANDKVDTVQILLSGEGVCLGSVGVAVQSPSGMTSILKLPNDSYRFDGIENFGNFLVSSVAFYGEAAQGEWKVFTLAANPDIPLDATVIDEGSGAEHHPKPCTSTNANGSIKEYQFEIEARLVTQ